MYYKHLFENASIVKLCVSPAKPAYDPVTLFYQQKSLPGTGGIYTSVSKVYPICLACVRP